MNESTHNPVVRDYFLTMNPADGTKYYTLQPPAKNMVSSIPSTDSESDVVLGIQMRQNRDGASYERAGRVLSREDNFKLKWQWISLDQETNDRFKTFSVDDCISMDLPGRIQADAMAETPEQLQSTIQVFVE